MNYHCPDEERGYIYPRLPDQNHCCDYWYTNDKNMGKLFDINNNFPVKHWWQDVVKEIVEYEG